MRKDSSKQLNRCLPVSLRHYLNRSQYSDQAQFPTSAKSTTMQSLLQPRQFMRTVQKRRPNDHALRSGDIQRLDSKEGSPISRCNWLCRQGLHSDWLHRHPVYRTSMSLRVLSEGLTIFPGESEQLVAIFSPANDLIGESSTRLLPQHSV